MTKCSVEECTRPAKSRGWCNTHYERWRRYGTTLTRNAPRGSSDEERLRWVGWTVTESGCWEWKGYHPVGRYGTLRTSEGRVEGVHRVAYRVWVGPIPEGQVVRHKCDNPPCINPDHLEIGTVGDNNQDKIDRGRCNSAKKLTWTEVREMRSSGDSQRAIANKYGVAQATVWAIVNHKIWIVVPEKEF